VKMRFLVTTLGRKRDVGRELNVCFVDSRDWEFKSNCAERNLTLEGGKKVIYKPKSQARAPLKWGKKKLGFAELGGGGGGKRDEGVQRHSQNEQ